MENLKLKILSKLKEIRVRKLVYPSISGLFILAALTLFVFSANFVSKHINRALDDGEFSGNILSLNKNDFEPVSKKLNIKINENAVIQIETAASEQPPAVETTPAQNTATSTEATSTPPAAPGVTTEEKLALKISVLNSTKTSGLAAGLKKILEESGFSVGNTGNTSPAIDGTLIKLKTGKEKFKESLVSAISAKYSSINFQEIPEDNSYDIIVIIGK